MLVEKPRQMPRTGGGDIRQRIDCPGAGRIRADCVLGFMNGPMEMTSSLQPWRHLRICARPAQIDDECASGRKRRRMANLARYNRQHQIDASRHAGTGHAFAVFDEEPVFQDARGRRQPSEV
ncbi:hypothetical protein D3C73_1403680 [compost metagenome]